MADDGTDIKPEEIIMDMDGNGSLLGKILTWLIIGVVAIVALKLAFWLLGVVMGLVGAAVGLVGLLVTLAVPLAVVVGMGWLAVKAYRAFTKSPVY